MNTIKDLMNDAELMQNIVEDLDDYSEDTKVTYELWAIGYNKEDKVTDAELFLGEFTGPDLAIKKADSLTFSGIIQLAAEEDCVIPDEPVAYLSIEVETVVEDDNIGTMNIGTIFRRKLCVDDFEDNDIDTLIHVKDNEYVLDEDGNLIISCDQFNHLNKNDRIKVMYDDEDNTPVLTYTIKSKTTDNKFVCEFEY